MVDITSGVNLEAGKARWHVKLEFVYEGREDESCQDGVRKIRTALEPLIENGSGIKQIFLLSLPERD
jgi:hypothetical protein